LDKLRLNHQISNTFLYILNAKYKLYTTLPNSTLHVQLKQPPSNAPRPSPGLDTPRRVLVFGRLPQRLEVHEQAQRSDGAHDSRDDSEDRAGGPRLVDLVVAAVEGGVLEADEPGAPSFAVTVVKDAGELQCEISSSVCRR